MNLRRRYCYLQDLTYGPPRRFQFVYCTMKTFSAGAIAVAFSAAAYIFSPPPAGAADSVEHSPAMASYAGDGQNNSERANAGSGLILLVSALVGFTLACRRKAA